jgi:flagellar basal body-associated protein FliL
MEDQPLTRISSSDHGVSIWIILAAILILSAATGVGALRLLTSTQQGQLPTGSQTVPTR